MASIVVAGDTSGSITLAAPAIAGSNTLTLPANTGTVITTASTFAGTGPAFSAYLGSNQTLSSATWTKLQINTEEFDTNNNYDPTTNYRFTPTVAGYYQFSAEVFAGNGNNTAVAGAIYKNGSVSKYAVNYSTSANILDDWGVTIATLIYMNGTTDYVELYGFAVGTTLTINSGAAYTFFQGFLARSA